MEVQVVAVGRPKLAYARLGVEEYAARLPPYGKFRLDFVKAGGGPEEEGARLFGASEGAVRVALDEKGWAGRTEAWRERFDQWQREGVRRVAFLIGGAEGQGAEVKGRCERWSLGPITLAHELALLVVMEQIYRVQTLRRGEPYHRA